MLTRETYKGELNTIPYQSDWDSNQQGWFAQTDYCLAGFNAGQATSLPPHPMSHLPAYK